MVYYTTHLTGRFRLCKKKDGSYVLQDEWVNESKIIKEEPNRYGGVIRTYETWWEDRETHIEEEQ